MARSPALCAALLSFCTLLISAAAEDFSFPSLDTGADAILRKVASLRHEAGLQTLAKKSPSSSSSKKKFNPTVVVAKDGSGDFKSVQKAVDSLKQNVLSPKPLIIYIKKGVYVENVTIPKALTKLSMVGDPGQTKITFNKFSGQLNERGDPIGTANTGTVAVLADDFSLINMIIENSAPRPPPAAVGYQAVAFRASGTRLIAYNSSFYSYQDTLYAHKGLQYYKNCFIFGEIDFIFGYAKAMFDGCTFFMDSRGYAAVAAQHRMYPNEDDCFVIINSVITGRNKGFLGRAWGRYACTIVAYSQLGLAVDPIGWNDFGVPARRLNSFFAEYRNRGIGANLDGRVWWQKVLSPQQVAYYLTTNYIGLKSWIRELPIAKK